MHALVHLLHRATQIADAAFEAAETGLTSRQWALLEAIINDPKRSQIEIATGIGMDRSTCAEVMRRLVAKGLVKRKRDRDDARAWKVQPTDEGRKIYAAYSGLVATIDTKLCRVVENADSLKLMLAAISTGREARLVAERGVAPGF